MHLPYFRLRNREDELIIGVRDAGKQCAIFLCGSLTMRYGEVLLSSGNIWDCVQELGIIIIMVSFC